VTAFLVALALAAPAADAAAAARFEAANGAYLAGDFATAARGYEALLADGFESPALHLDLGNARLRLGKRGLAAASYERALRLDPSDADARFNLALARADDVDRVLGAGEPPLAIRAAERVPDGAAAAVLGTGWAALWLALALGQAAPRRVRALLAGAAVAAGLAAVLAAALLLAKAADRRTPAAIVIAPASPVREGPEEALRPAFELHEGTRVRVLEVRGAAARVRLENALEGWMATGDLEPI